MQRTVEFSEIGRQHEELKKIVNHLQTTATRKASKLSGERWRAALLEIGVCPKKSLLRNSSSGLA